LKTVRRTVEVHVEINAVKERERDCWGATATTISS
jgi:hypothetical protein